MGRALTSRATGIRVAGSAMGETTLGGPFATFGRARARWHLGRWGQIM